MNICFLFQVLATFYKFQKTSLTTQKGHLKCLQFQDIQNAPATFFPKSHKVVNRRDVEYAVYIMVDLTVLYFCSITTQNPSTD